MRGSLVSRSVPDAASKAECPAQPLRPGSSNTTEPSNTASRTAPVAGSSDATKVSLSTRRAGQAPGAVGSLLSTERSRAPERALVPRGP